MQAIDPPSPFRLAITDLSALDSDQQSREVRSQVTADAQQPFVLAERLFRVRLLRLGPTRHVLLLSLHHIVSDFWSHRVLLRELGLLYTGHVHGVPPTLPELSVQYADYVLWQREWLQGERLAEQVAYWKTHLAGAPSALPLPTDRPRPPVFSLSRLPPVVHLAARVDRRDRRSEPSRRGDALLVLLAAFQLLLARWSAQTDIVVGSPWRDAVNVRPKG